MASTYKPDPDASKSEVRPPHRDYFAVEVGLRVLLFLTTLTAFVVMSTAKQTENVPVPGIPGLTLPIEAKFNHSPALVYFVAALSVACLYSVITTLGVIAKPIYATKLLFYYALWDALILGMIAAATGAAGGVGYIGLKGNSHVGWRKICDVYDTFCQHMASAVVLSLIASIVLILLIMLSVCSLYSRVPRAE